jgi:ligand-binding sensor domain-containing protein
MPLVCEEEGLPYWLLYTIQRGKLWLSHALGLWRRRFTLLLYTIQRGKLWLSHALGL